MHVGSCQPEVAAQKRRLPRNRIAPWHDGDGLHPPRQIESDTPFICTIIQFLQKNVLPRNVGDCFKEKPFSSLVSFSMNYVVLIFKLKSRAEQSTQADTRTHVE